MNIEIQRELEKKFNFLFNSIPEDYLKFLNRKSKDKFGVFADSSGIPKSSIIIFRKLAALLIFNRIRFIKYNKDEKNFLGLSIKEMSSKLKKLYPKLFISSIIEEIGNQSTTLISISNFDIRSEFFNEFSEFLSSKYLKIVNQQYRRKMGQFWTPWHVSELMVQLAIEKNPHTILDPCIGPGTFIMSLSEIFPSFSGKIVAYEIHPVVFELASVNLSQIQFLKEIYCSNFLISNPEMENNSLEEALEFNSKLNNAMHYSGKETCKFNSIVCNPPYSRHHELSSFFKSTFGKEIEKTFGGRFNRLSSLFMYFILKSLKLLYDNGRMVFITPTITFESRNSLYLKKILKEKFSISYIVVFDKSMNVFQGVDTAACIFVIEGSPPDKKSVTKLLELKKWISPEKIRFILGSDSVGVIPSSIGNVFFKKQLDLNPYNNWTSSRPFLDCEKNKKLVEISYFFKVMRGIATGNNKFFTLTDKEVESLGLKSFVVPTITKTRHIQKFFLSKSEFEKIKSENKKVWLLYIQEKYENCTESPLNRYITFGLNSRVQEGSLVKKRKFWYSLEKREIPSIIYTYLSRGSPRFILNEAYVRPLNTFLMFYTKKGKLITSDYLNLFWVILNSSYTIKSLQDVGRSYGGDTLKIEPREMHKALILDPYKLSKQSRNKLLAIVEELREIELNKKASIINKIDSIIKHELEI